MTEPPAGRADDSADTSADSSADSRVGNGADGREAVGQMVGRVLESLRRALRIPRRRKISHLLAAATFGFAGFLAVTSAYSAGGTDLRAERETDLGDLVRAAVQRDQELQQQAKGLRDSNSDLSRQIAGVDTSPVQRQTSQLDKTVGLTPVEGPGITVTLDDAPASMRDQTTDPDILVVHQQDIQAVANAMWAAGAESMTIQGQRVISTSAIRCVGNSVVVEGQPYPPPYHIAAIGPVSTMIKAIGVAPGVRLYLDDAARYHLGYSLDRSDHLEMPAYKGSLGVQYAKPGASSSTPNR